MTETQEQLAQERLVVGKVVSDKMNKTIVVEVVRNIKHPFYGKYIRRSTRLYAHDDNNVGKFGDQVLIKQSRPMSKTKNWILVKVLESTQNTEQ